MSLQLAAQHLASRGRGPDTTLVHMAPQEVAGLQALAKAHGGTLTINPDTGLAEAGFLSSLLPTLIGVGLSVASGGALTPLMAAGITGAGYGVATGSLSKGLMAGLGAYGGAGLAGSVMGAGTGALSASAAPMSEAVAPALANTPAAPLVDITAGMGDVAAAEGAGVAGTNIPTMGRSAATQTLGSTVANPTGIPGFQGTNLGLTPTPSVINAAQAVTQATPTITQAPVLSPDLYPTALSQNAADIGNIYAQEQAAQNAVAKQLAGTTPMGTAKAGLNAIYEKPELLFNKGNLKYAGAAALPMMFQDPQKLPEKDKLKPFEYSYDPGRVSDPQAEYTGAYTGERTYFNPTYTRTAAGGGLMDIGPVQAMSDRNEAQTLMANGGQMFAEGGETKAGRSVEENPYYTMSGQSGDAFKYLMGQMPARAPAPAAAPVLQPAVQPVVGQPTLQPIDRTSGGVMGAVRGLLKEPTSDATLRPYTFDPATGMYTALPIVAPKSSGFAGSAFGPSYEQNIFYGGGYGNSDSSAASTSSSGGGGGMSNQGEGGPDGVGGWAHGGIASLAQGGPSHLGDYSDGGRLLKGPGDGVSDSIPATIANKRPARLADGEFVVPARIVSELGNGSTEAGARKLYAMMDRVQKARKKSIGKNRVAVNSRAEKMLPA